MPKHFTPKPIKGRKINYSELKAFTWREIRRNPSQVFTSGRIQKMLKVSNTVNEILTVLKQLQKEGKLNEVKQDGFQVAPKSIVRESVFTGKVDITRSGAAYIIVEGKDDDIFVPAGYLKNAMDGDIVQVVVSPRGRRRGLQGKITSIVRRARNQYMGKYFGNEKRGSVLPFKAPDGFEITIFKDKRGGATDGDIVVVDVYEWPSDKSKLTLGEITEVFGKINPAELEMKSILIQQGFGLHFSKESIRESEKIPDTISDEEIKNRRDMRDVLTFTIDPENAKDFDDALSYRVLENGHTEIGVHIADVTHYLSPGSALDTEAYERSTSVYLVDRVLPMLPERLSNELCSLRPNEDKLTFSGVFEFDAHQKIVSTWFGKTIIHSNRRFTYEEAQERLEKEVGDFAAELILLNKLAKVLREKRYKHGAIAFESDEVMFHLDENGFPIQLFVKERKEAHMLVEDFMLLANRSAAEFIRHKGRSGEIPFIYRVHDLPNKEKLEDFAKFAAEMGYKLDISNPKAIAKSLNSLAEKAESDEKLKVLTPLAIRTMAKAEYTTNNIGHYGLGFDDYTHFTSPIRRYSDVLAHRILFKNLGDQIFKADKTELEAQCKHISAQERKAMEAERESIKYKQVEFMTQFVGKEFDGIISGLHERGLFVELIENLCEGMVRFDRFNEGFTIDESKLKASGNRSGRVIKMGDTIRVRVIDTDLDRRQIELDIVETE